jgi:tryptophan synthase alpha chain
MSKRYEDMFARLREEKQGAFVPFTVLGDPDKNTSIRIIETLINAGADALELGIPFSDPVADGPTIQKADVRALASGANLRQAFEIISNIRKSNTQIPIGLLVYANLVGAEDLSGFYQAASKAGVDSVLIADVPTLEIKPYLEVAKQHDLLQVLIATPNCSLEQLNEIATLSQGYTYVVTRFGVTGIDKRAETDNVDIVSKLKNYSAPPCLVGFGISTPKQVRSVIGAGADGAISGSAVVKIIENNLGDNSAMLSELLSFVKSMKAATHPGGVN